MTSTAATPTPSSGNLNFVLVCVFIDMLGIGLIVPVLPVLVTVLAFNFMGDGLRDAADPYH